jgi:hypothetical protein
MALFSLFCVLRWPGPLRAGAGRCRAVAGAAGRSGRRQRPGATPFPVPSVTRATRARPQHGGHGDSAPRPRQPATPRSHPDPRHPGPRRRDGRRDGRHAQLARERHRPPAGRGRRAPQAPARARAARAVLLNLHIHDTKDYHGASVKYTCACSAHLFAHLDLHMRG